MTQSLPAAVGNKLVSANEMRRLVLLVYALVFVTELSQAAIVPLLPTYGRELSLSEVETGAILAATTFATVLVAVPIGLTADRLGSHRLTIVAALVDRRVGAGAGVRFELRGAPGGTGPLRDRVRDGLDRGAVPRSRCDVGPAGGSHRRDDRRRRCRSLRGTARLRLPGRTCRARGSFPFDRGTRGADGRAARRGPAPDRGDAAPRSSARRARRPSAGITRSRRHSS